MTHTLCETRNNNLKQPDDKIHAIMCQNENVHSSIILVLLFHLCKLSVSVSSVWSRTYNPIEDKAIPTKPIIPQSLDNPIKLLLSLLLARNHLHQWFCHCTGYDQHQHHSTITSFPMWPHKPHLRWFPMELHPWGVPNISIQLLQAWAPWSLTEFLCW